MAVGRRLQFLATWASPRGCSQHSLWLARTDNLRAREHTQCVGHCAFCHLILEMRCYHFCYIPLAHRSTLVHCGRGVLMRVHIKGQGSLGPSQRLPAGLSPPPSFCFPALLCGLCFLYILSTWLGMMALQLPALRSRAEAGQSARSSPWEPRLGDRRACGPADLIRADSSILERMGCQPGAAGTCLCSGV